MGNSQDAFKVMRLVDKVYACDLLDCRAKSGVNMDRIPIFDAGQRSGARYFA